MHTSAVAAYFPEIFLSSNPQPVSATGCARPRLRISTAIGHRCIVGQSRLRALIQPPLVDEHPRGLIEARNLGAGGLALAHGLGRYGTSRNDSDQS